MPQPSARSPISPYVMWGGKVTVRVGTIMYALDAEPVMAKWLATPIPSAWPWLAPQSSDARVLSPLRLCTNVYLNHAYPTRIYAFRARRAGTATLYAPLTPAWRSRSAARRPSGYRATVIVQNRRCFARRAAVELALPLGRRSRSVVGTRETLGCPSIDVDSRQAAK
jgi:hypothetical protein